MVLPSSGQLSLSQINTELGRSSTAEIGLGAAETGTYGAINTLSTCRPDGAPPSTVSEWYGYNHTAGPTTLGQSAFGGFYTGTICAAGTTYYLILSPNASGCARCRWKLTRTTTAGTTSCIDGRANTYGPMDNADHPAGNFTATRTINGFSDWYMPARDELNIMYTNQGSMPAGEEFAFGFWFSSTEATEIQACGQGFPNDGYFFLLPKNFYNFVRAIRRVPV